VRGQRLVGTDGRGMVVDSIRDEGSKVRRRYEEQWCCCLIYVYNDSGFMHKFRFSFDQRGDRQIAHDTRLCR
jgi:hypothetical protein